jgi:hypothetical protein
MLQPPSMFTAPTDLPEDPATLQAILRAALTEIERLQLLIAGLQRNRFGRRSETLGETAAQQGTEDLVSTPLQTRNYLLKCCQMAVLRFGAPDCPGSP